MALNLEPTPSLITEFTQIWRTWLDRLRNKIDAIINGNITFVSITTDGLITSDQTTSDLPFINFKATADADATSAVSTLTTSAATTHHIQVDINGVKAWIAVSTTNPTA